MAVSYRIEVLEGARRGDKLPVKRARGLLIGRGKKLVDLLDSQVSTRHCAIEWQDDRFTIRDLGSANGTRVDGVEVGPEPVALADGVTIGLGESVLRFVETRSVLPQWVYWAALVALVLSTPGFIQLLIDWRLWDRMVPTIEAPAAVMGHAGSPLSTLGKSHILPLDRCLMREVQSNGDGLSIRRVTDWDGDGVSELWVEGQGWERVYTFDRRGNWQLLGELPQGCQNSTGTGFRDLHCGNKLYRFRTGLPFQPSANRCVRGSNKGRYDLARMNGAVVWMNGPGGPLGQPVPYQFGLKGQQDIATWLGERGVDSPVHFLVCEDMFPGIGAQVLTAAGSIERLQPGCANTLEIGGGRAGEYTSRPYAVAFTETGRKALVRELGVFLGGSELGHFQNPDQRAWWASLDKNPIWHSASFVFFNPSPNAAVRFFNPIPPEDSRLKTRPFSRLGGLQVPGRLRASVWEWMGSGTVLQTPCGQYVKIDPAGWRCGPPCVRGQSFLRISQVNGPEWTVPYKAATGQRFRGAGIELAVDVVEGPPGFVPQAVAATVAVRDNQVCTGSPVFQGPQVKTSMD